MSINAGRFENRAALTTGCGSTIQDHKRLGEGYFFLTKLSIRLPIHNWVLILTNYHTLRDPEHDWFPAFEPTQTHS